MDPNTVTMRVAVDVETGGDTDAEELGWMLNMLREELRRWPRWRGKIRSVQLLPAAPAAAATEADLPIALPA